MHEQAPEDRIRRRMLQPVQLALYLTGSMLSFMAVAPLFWMVSMSLKETNEVFSANLIPHRPTLDSFIYVFTQVNFFRYLWNTFFVSAVVTIVALAFHSMAGYALARLRFPGRDAIFLAMFATFLISQPVIIVPLFILARTLGCWTATPASSCPRSSTRSAFSCCASSILRFRANWRKRRS